MKINNYMKVMMVAGMGALASCAPQPVTQKVSVSTSLRPDSSLNGRIFQEVNQYRNSCGKAAVQRHSGLDRLAQKHCEYLRQNRGKFGLYGKNVSHFGFEGRAVMAREAYSMASVGENVASTRGQGGDVSNALVKLWISSKDHEYNMRAAWTHTGVGAVVDSDGTVFSTQIFATVSNHQMMMRQRFASF
jgi:uncharacterized protein YkwD